MEEQLNKEAETKSNKIQSEKKIALDKAKIVINQKKIDAAKVEI